ncbi:MAG: PQQ-binding-like beta-propeller repeat protein [Acidimicrobiia bacterium]
MSPIRPLQVGAGLAILLAATSIALFSMFAPEESTAAPGTLPDLGTLVTTTDTNGGTATSEPSSTTLGATTSTTAFTQSHAWVDRSTVGEPWGTAVEGLLTFRGNPTNTYYGQGPVPSNPEKTWKYPDNPMCSQSTDLGQTTTWCGNGWTGQPVIWEREDGVTEMIFGAYDGKLHFVDAKTGRKTRDAFQTGDLIKGTPTIDPDGYPIVYFGSRDNKLRALALDRGEPVELWAFEICLPKPSCPEPSDTVAVEGQWNDDWDASPRIVNDILFEGAENGWYYIWKLNRAYDNLGLVTIQPTLLFKMSTYDDALLEKIGLSYPAISVENTTAIFEGRAYFANSAGRVIGLDITNIENGEAPVVFDYWVGDDVDASIVIDEEGFLYVSAEYERYLQQAQDVGQLIKLDPYTAGDPWVWGMFSLTTAPAKGGLWSTPALGDGVLYAVTNKGFLVVVDQATGEEIAALQLAPGSWSSPVVVGNDLIVAAQDGLLRKFNITDPRSPVLDWSLVIGSHLESTPAVWKGMIYVGSRDGFMYAVGDKNT